MKVLKPPQSGSIAGTTASHNRFGQYERNRRKPVHPIGTGRPAVVRANFRAASSGFSGLTQSQIQAWSAYALAHPVVDALGQSVKLTGHMMYVACSASLLNVGEAPLPDPPISSVVDAITSLKATITADPIIGITYSLGSATGYIVCAVSKQLNAGRTYQKTFSQAQYQNGLSIIQDITAWAVSKLGAPTAGKKIFLRVTAVNQYGVSGTPQIIPVVVSAATSPGAMVATSVTSGTVIATFAAPDPRNLQLEALDPVSGDWTAVSTASPESSPYTFTARISGKTYRVTSSDGTGALLVPSNNIVCA